MFGYASDETSTQMPLTHMMATKLGKTLTEVRKDGSLWWLRPDGKTQVTIKYIQHTDGSVEPLKIHTVVISTQHAEPLKAKRSDEEDGKDNRPKYTGAEMIAPSMEAMNEEIHEKVIVATLKSIKLKNGKDATSIYDRATCNLHINPSGKFIIGGPQGDAGLTGRKIIVDTYGGWGAHGGGAFSGKDPTKVDRSAAYACRWMAKSVVKAGLCKRALVQLSYAIGVAKPLSLFVETYGSEQGELTAKAITDIVKMEFDARPRRALARDLVLREPKYNPTAARREPYEKDGMKFFSEPKYNPTCHFVAAREKRDEVLLVGEREGPLEVRLHDGRPGRGGAQGLGLPHEVGRLERRAVRGPRPPRWNSGRRPAAARAGERGA